MCVAVVIVGGGVQVATMRADYKKKLANAESQLNGVVQAKVTAGLNACGDTDG